MAYVDGFVLSVPKAKLAAYKKMASQAGKIWREHGALEYKECVGEDLASAKKHKMVSFTDLAGAKKTEVVVFAYVVFKSRAHRDKVNAKVMADERLKDACSGDIFDYTRMAYGGFDALVDA